MSRPNARLLGAACAVAVICSALVAAGLLSAADPAVPEVPPAKGKSETVKLFNGKDLEGWEGYPEHWSVVDGVIVGKNTEKVPTSTYLLTKGKYRDFALKFSSKLVTSEMHSGVAIWGRVPPDNLKDPESDAVRGKYTYQGHLVMFPSGWGMYDLFRRNGLPVDGGPAKKVGKQHDWNDMEIFAQGNRIRHVVNGVLVVDYREPKPELIMEAPIGLQLHSNGVPQEVHFKGLVLTTFPDDKRLEGKKINDKVDPPTE